MSLNINVNVPPRLIEQAREQQVERRLAMVQRQRQDVVRKEAVRKVQQERVARGLSEDGKVPIGGTLEQRRRQWDGATAVLAKEKIGAVIEYITNQSYYNGIIPIERFEYKRRLLSNGQLLPLGMPLYEESWYKPLYPPIFMMLPVKDNIFIHVEVQPEQSGWDAPVVAAAVRCYVANNTIARQIQTPAGLIGSLEPLEEVLPIYGYYADQILRNFNRSVAWGAGYYPQYIADYSTYLWLILRGRLNAYHEYLSRAWTPGVYYWLAKKRVEDQDNLPDASIALQVVGSRIVPWLMGKPVQFIGDVQVGPPGWFLLVDNIENGVDSTENLVKLFWSNAQKTSRHGTVLAPAYADEETFGPRQSRALHYCWDWGQPEFCRQQLLELGFKPEDLIP